MDKTVKTIGVIILVGGAAYGVNKLLGLRNLADKANILLRNTRIQSVDLSGIELRTDVIIQNPTNQEITISQPFVKLLKGDSLIGSSTPTTDNNKIKAMSESALHTVSLNISMLEAIKLIANITGKAIAAGKLLTNAKGIINSLGLKLEYSLYVGSTMISQKTDLQV